MGLPERCARSVDRPRSELGIHACPGRAPHQVRGRGPPGCLEPQHPAAWGGPRAGAHLAPAVGKPRCSTIARTPQAPFTYATTRRRPPHPTQANTSKSNVLLSHSAWSTRGVLSFLRSLLAAASSPPLASSAPAGGTRNGRSFGATGPPPPGPPARHHRGHRPATTGVGSEYARAPRQRWTSTRGPTAAAARAQREPRALLQGARQPLLGPAKGSRGGLCQRAGLRRQSRERQPLTARWRDAGHPGGSRLDWRTGNARGERSSPLNSMPLAAAAFSTRTRQ
jgi:hypothetical protein